MNNQSNQSKKIIDNIINDVNEKINSILNEIEERKQDLKMTIEISDDFEKTFLLDMKLNINIDNLNTTINSLIDLMNRIEIKLISNDTYIYVNDIIHFDILKQLTDGLVTLFKSLINIYNNYRYLINNYFNNSVKLLIIEKYIKLYKLFNNDISIY